MRTNKIWEKDKDIYYNKYFNIILPFDLTIKLWSYVSIGLFAFFNFLVSEFELRASCLQGRHSTAWAMPTAVGLKESIGHIPTVAKTLPLLDCNQFHPEALTMVQPKEICWTVLQLFMKSLL
jgi:hypothetical protein